MSGDRSTRPPDLRLVATAVGTWLSSLAALYADPAVTCGVAVAAVAAAAAVWTLSLRRTPVGRAAPSRLAPPGTRLDRTGPARWVSSAGPARWVSWAGSARWTWIAVAALLGVVCGSVATAARTAVRDAEPLATMAAHGAHVRADLVVRDDPRAIGTAGRPALLVSAELLRVEPDSQRPVRLRVAIIVLATDDGWRPLLPGQRVRVSGRLLPARPGDLRAAALSTTEAPVLVGRPGWGQRAAGALRAGLRLACEPLPDEPGGLLPGLVIGDTSRLPATVADDFRATGLTHLVAVSGANLAIVAGLVLLLARWARAGPRTAALASGAALIGFVILARPSPSVVRAAAMAAVALLALASGRPRAAVPALGAAVIVLVTYDPALAGDPGFALSVLATAGLLLLAPRWRDALRRRGVPAGVAEALAVPAAAQAACAPVVAALSGSVSLVAVPANLLAVPAIAPATVLGVVAATVSPVWPAAAEFCAWLGGWPARWLVAVARYGAGLPAGAVPWPAGVAGGLLLAAATAGVLFAGRWPLVRRIVAVVVVAALVGALPVRLVATGWPPAGWLVVACAVGQGDAVVLPAGPGAAVVVDAGPEPAATDRCLRRLGIRRVRVLVISHFHADHVGGVAGVFRGRRVDAVLGSDWPEPVLGRRLVGRTVTAVNTHWRSATAGWSYRAGDLVLTVVGPVAPMRGTRSDPNNNSLVVRAVVRGVPLVLAGDAEGEEQRAVVERVGRTPLRAAVLKLAHHGSAFQDAEFLDAVDPAIVLVSVGAGNRYGHPNPALLDALVRDGARVLRTDVDGDVAAVLHGGRLAAVARGLGPGEPSP